MTEAEMWWQFILARAGDDDDDHVVSDADFFLAEFKKRFPPQPVEPVPQGPQ